MQNAALDSIPRLYRPRVFTREAKQRFSRSRTQQLIAHVGIPTTPQLILISRVVELEWQTIRLARKFDDQGELSGHDMRALLAAENRIRLDLAAIGWKGQADRQPTLAEILARGAEESACGAGRDGAEPDEAEIDHASSPSPVVSEAVGA